MSKLSFDASKVKPREAFDVIPSDWYLAALTGTALKPTKAKPGKPAGERLEVEFTILDGEYKGRKIFDGLNTKNASAAAQDIGQQQLSAICHATGVFKITDTAQLHDKPMLIKVGMEAARKGEDGTEYDARNVYKGCKPVEGATTTGAGTPEKEVPAFLKKPAVAPKPEPKALVWALKDGVDASFGVWVVLEDGVDPEDLTVDAVLEKLTAGLDPASVASVQTDKNGGCGDFVAITEFFEQVEEAAPEPTPEPAKKSPGKAPAAPAKGNTPPWKKK